MATPTGGKRDVRAGKKAKAEKGASVRFIPADAAPQLHTPGRLPVSYNERTDPCAAQRLSSAPGLTFYDDKLFSRKDNLNHEVVWTALAECNAHFPLAAWMTLMHTLVEHPERNSSYILRSDILARCDPHSTLSLPNMQPGLTSGRLARPSRLAQVVCAGDSDSDSDSVSVDHRGAIPSNSELDSSYRLRQTVYRRLLPRNPILDQPMDQLCYFYDRRARSDEDLAAVHEDGDGLVVYIPLLPPGCTVEQIPWYHPKVRALAFRFLSSGAEAGTPLPDGTPTMAKLRIDAVLFSDADGPLQGAERLAAHPSSRLMRTCKALLDLQHKHALGIARSYTKRVHHDVLVPQAAFQDRYVALKQVHALRLVQTWKEATDPKKHVYEDVAIAAFLIELWAQTYPLLNGKASPPGGFVDLGCGNGLLVHILRSEGFEGFGVDVRARQSWAQYETQPHAPVDERDLRVSALDPPHLVASALEAQEEQSRDELSKLLPRDCFLIGNHADELTPWVPLLAACAPGNQVGFINIPCCPWRVEGDRFGRTTMGVSTDEVRQALERAGHVLSPQSVSQVQEAIVLGPPAETDTNGDRDVRARTQARTRNAAYLAYVSWLHLQAGWMVEKEALRIPSTKNWALVGRTRTWAADDFTYQTRPSTADPAAPPTLVAGNALPHKAQGEYPTRKDVVRHVAQLASLAHSWAPRLPEGNTARLAPSMAHSD